MELVTIDRAERGSPLLMGIVEQDSTSTHAMLTSEGFQTSKEGEDNPNAKRQKVKTHVEFYFASDASAMVEHTKRVLHLEDDDVAHLHNGGYGIYRMERIVTTGIESPVTYEPTAGYGFIHSFIHSFILSFIHSFIHS